MNPNSPAAIRARLAAAKATPARPPEPAPADPPAATPQRPKKPTGPALTHRCGHTRPLADLTNQDCPGCREAARRAKAQKKRVKASGAKPGKAKVEDHGRLPDRARFVVEYDAGRTMWSGKLELTSGPPYEGEASGVEFLLRDFARRWRVDATTPTQEAADESPVVAPA